MSKKTWILISCLVLSLTLGLGGSLAYLTDTDTKINTFTMGNVEIEVTEPTSEENGYNYDIMPGVEVAKEAFITNTGSNNAYVWMTAAIPAELADYVELIWRTDDDEGAWLGDNPDVGAENRYLMYDEAGREYVVETYMWFNQLANGDITDNLLLGVKLDEYVNIIDGQYYYMGKDENGNSMMEPLPSFEGMEIVVTGHAIQADGMGESWEQAYMNYMGQWKDHLMVEQQSESVGKTYTESDEINEFIVLSDNSEDDNCVVASGADTVVTIKGGKYDIGTNYNSCAVWAIEGATVIIENGDFWGDARENVTSTEHLDLIYAGSRTQGAGTIKIYGGSFGLDGSTPGNPGGWLLNARDNVGKITVYGGRFLNWNPAGNVSEGNPTNFLPEEGYEVWTYFDNEESQWFEVFCEGDNPADITGREEIYKVWPIE